jgi:hypothetical protein
LTDDSLRTRLDEYSDEELLDILRRHDTEEWQAVVFPLVEEILLSRGVDTARALAGGPQTVAPDEEDDPFVAIASFATVVESEACRSALTAAGFTVANRDQYLLQVDPALGPALGGVQLGVPASEADEAREFLAAAESGTLASGLIECPTCGSGDVESRRDVSRAGTIMNTLLLGPAVRDVTITFQCRSCGAAWE